MTVRISSPTATIRQAGKPDRLMCRSQKMAAETRPSKDAIMARSARRLLTVAVLGLVLAMPAARAQAPAPQPVAATSAPAPQPVAASSAQPIRRNLAQLLEDVPDPLPSSATPTTAGGWEPQLLQFLPQPPDQPRSLFQQAPPPGPPPPNLERYFEVDPILDTPLLRQQPGWFTDVQIGLIHPHIFAGRMQALVPVPGVRGVRVHPGAAQQNWTVSPRLEIGYWLPSGFGGFSFSDRFFSSSGTGPFVGPAGSTTRTSRLGVNYSDWDYISHEFTPWNTPRANWTLKWRGGVRLAETWYDSQVYESFAKAAAGTGVLSAGASNYTVGAGPHFGIEVNRLDLPSGFTFITRLDIADTFTRERQLYSAATTTLTPAGVPTRGATTSNFWQEVPILNFQVGLGWQPPRNPNISLYLGYLYEFWWQTMTRSSPETTFGSFDNQGVVFQAQLKW